MLIVLQYITQAVAMALVSIVLYDYLKWRKNHADDCNIDSLCDYLGKSDQDRKED